MNGQLRDVHPASLGIQAEMPLHRRRQFNAFACVGLAVGYGRDHQFGEVAPHNPRNHDNNRTILQTFFSALSASSPQR